MNSQRNHYRMDLRRQRRLRRVKTAVVVGASVLSLLSVNAVSLPVVAQTVTAVTAVPTTAESTTYLGTVEGTRAFAAIVTRNGKAIVYVCDSKKIAVWLKGTFIGGQLNVSSKAGDTLTGTPEYAELKLLNSEPRVVTTAFSPFDDKAHFFVANSKIKGVAWAGGWITLADGRQRGNLRNESGQVFKAATVTTSTTSVSVPTGGKIGVRDYLKDWDKLPVAIDGLT